MKILNKIIIENFKSIKRAEIELNCLNIFIGGNGVGKSNFIGAFKLLNSIIDQNLQNYTGKAGGAENILYFGRKKSDHLLLSLSFDKDVNGYLCKLVPNADGDFIFDQETVWFHDKKYEKPYEEDLGSGGLETKLYNRSKESIRRNTADHLITDLRSWTIYHFHDTSDSAKVKQACEIEDNTKLRSDAGNLAAFLYLLQKNHPDNFQNIQDTVRLAAPFFDKFNLQPSRLNSHLIKLEWLEKGSDSYFNASALSDGTLRFICLATLLLQPKLPSIILLDEPELGLHPQAINTLSGLIKKASKNAQIIIATQSVTFVNQFEPDNLFIVDREKEQTVFKNLGSQDIQSWVENYAIGELWEKNMIGGRPR
jgi:predicted ATPase